MRVSIIVPVYNVEKYIQSCIKSILAQDYNDIELIIVDDCSPDRSITIAKEIIAEVEIPVKIVVHKKNSGLSAARNSGIKVSTGDALFFIDSDDELSNKTVISHLVAELKDANADIVAGNYQRIYNNERIVSKRYSQRKVVQGKDNIIDSFCQGDIPITAWNKLIRADFVFKNNLFFKEGLIHEDELWSFQCIMVANIFVLTGKTTYNYYQQESSIMSEKVHCRLESSIKVYNEMTNSYIQNATTRSKRLATHLNRFAFQRYREIMKIKDYVVRKELYNKLREKQLAIKTPKNIKEQYMHFHLHLPSILGFYTMSLTTYVYRIILNLKQR